MDCQIVSRSAYILTPSVVLSRSAYILMASVVLSRSLVLLCIFMPSVFYRSATVRTYTFITREVLLMPIHTPAEFGAALRARRKQLHYTQAYIAQVTGFSVSFLSDLERGKATAELGKALFLVNLLGLDCVLTERGK